MRALALAVVLAGCFGSGPTPGVPGGVQIVMHLDSTPGCATESYLDDIAIGSDRGYATAVLHEDFTGNCNGLPPMVPVPVYAFDKQGGGDTMIGSAGQSSGGQHPHVCGAPHWAYGDPSNTANLVLDDGASAMLSQLSGAGELDPAGLACDDAAIYLAGWGTTGGGASDENVESPTYPPCSGCGDIGGQMPTGASFTRFALNGPTTQLPISLPQGDTLACNELEDCFLESGAMLWFVTENASQGTGTVWSFPAAATGTLVSAAPVALGSGRALSGFAAAGDYVAWSVAPDFRRVHDQNDCEIYVRDNTSGTVANLVITTHSSCMGLAIDPVAQEVYFTLVHFGTASHGDNFYIHGDAIGRVSIAGQRVETLALHEFGDATGPRRVFVDGTDLYIAEPSVIAKLPASALDGKHDITP